VHLQHLRFMYTLMKQKLFRLNLSLITSTEERIELGGLTTIRMDTC